MRTRPSQVATTVAPHIDETASRDRTLLGRYRVLETRASGGFGSVEVCWDTRLQRRVAIKCMPLAEDGASGAAASTVEEALAEARTSSMLSHPNIVTVHDFEWDGENAYLVMEYVDGVNLAELLARVEVGVLMPAEVAHLLGGVASALSYAHENGVLHLDIKPANIMIDRTGTPKLGDFGMASLASAAGYGGARGGTVGYMPPEQVFGELVDERSDLFSLAACLLEALTGDNPYAADSADKSADLIEGGAEEGDVARVGLACGSEASSVLCDALAPMPQERTPSVEQFARAMVPALGDPTEGLVSLRELLDQLTRDDGVPTTAGGVPLSVPERAPWLPGLLGRLSCAALCAWLAILCVPSLGAGGLAQTLLGAAVCAACGALLPQLGCALVLVALVAAIGMTPEAAGASQVVGYERVGAVAILAVTLLLWWATCARREGLAAPGLLLGLCTRVPAAGVAFSGYALDPALAAATAGVSAWAAAVLSPTTGIPSGGRLWDAIALTATNPVAWARVALLAMAASATSAIGSRRGRAGAYVGQGVGLLLTTLALCLDTRMENGDIWKLPDMGHMAVAVLFFVLVCIVTAFLGGPNARQETVT